MPKYVTSSYIDNKLYLHFRLPDSFSSCDLFFLLFDKSGGSLVELERKHVSQSATPQLNSSSPYSLVLFDDTRLVTQQRYHVRVQVDFKDPAIAMDSKLKTVQESVVKEFIYVEDSFMSYG